MHDALVTGANGFIGQALIRALQKQGKNVISLTRAQGDIARRETWETLPPAKTVFHLAGASFVPDSWKTPEQFLHTNVTGTQCALEYRRSHNSSFVFASAYVYGIPQTLPISETHPATPNNPYALSKRLAEQCCEFAASYHTIPVTILRIFNIYGMHQRPHFLLPIILDAIVKRESIRVLDLAPRRDYIYLDDVVEAFLKSQRFTTGLRTLNIGSGTSHSVQEMIDIAQAVAGTALPVISGEHARANEIPDTIADITSARQLLDWTPTYRLEDGIRAIFMGMGNQ